MMNLNVLLLISSTFLAFNSHKAKAQLDCYTLIRYITFHYRSGKFPGFDKSLLPDDLQSELHVRLIKFMYPDIVKRKHRVSEEFSKFLRSIEEDHAIDFLKPTIQEIGGNSHFVKHRTDFSQIYIELNSNEQLLDSAERFSQSEGNPNRIVFRSKPRIHGGKLNSAVIKVDLNDFRILMTSPENGRVITYFPWIFEKRENNSFRHFMDQVFHRLYKNEI